MPYKHLKPNDIKVGGINQSNERQTYSSLITLKKHEIEVIAIAVSVQVETVPARLTPDTGTVPHRRLSASQAQKTAQIAGRDRASRTPMLSDLVVGPQRIVTFVFDRKDEV